MCASTWYNYAEILRSQLIIFRIRSLFSNQVYIWYATVKSTGVLADVRNQEESSTYMRTSWSLTIIYCSIKKLTVKTSGVAKQNSKCQYLLITWQAVRTHAFRLYASFLGDSKFPNITFVVFESINGRSIKWRLKAYWIDRSIRQTVPKLCPGAPFTNID